MDNILDNVRRLVPSELVAVRPATAADADSLARWIKRGRDDGHFRRGESLSPDSVLAYQNSVRKSGWVYHCMIVERNGRTAGYIDYRVRGLMGEILGIYLEPKFRGRKLGPHLIRWTLGDLRQKGCRHVLTEVYSSNVVSVRTCRATGFNRDKSLDRVEPQGIVWVLRRKLQPLSRFSDLDSQYVNLQGNNIYLHHAALAEVLTEHLKKLPGVQVVLGMGSLARQFADKWSDLDIAVVGSGASLNKLWRGEQYLAGISVDLFVVDLHASPPSKWDYTRRQAFEESVVLFARNESVLKDLKRAIRLTRDEVREAILEPLFKLGWIGFQPREWFNREKYGYLWGLPHDLWIQRGSVESAHATVDQAYNYAVQLLYLANGKHIPDPKWRNYLLPSLHWKPRGFAGLISAVLTASRDRAGFEERANAVFGIVKQTVAKLEEQKLLSANLYRAYLDVCPDYDSGA